MIRLFVLVPKPENKTNKADCLKPIKCDYITVISGVFTFDRFSEKKPAFTKDYYLSVLNSMVSA